MPANYLHGLETIEVDAGIRPIRVVKTAVIGLVGTAPKGPVNAVTLISSKQQAETTFGKVGEQIPGQTGKNYSIPEALDAIFDHGAGLVAVVNVFDPAVHQSGTPAQPDVAMVTAADIVGVSSPTRTGLQAFDGMMGQFGCKPKLLIAPEWSDQAAVRTELIAKAGALRAIALVDVAQGQTPQQVITARGANGALNTSSPFAVFCYPHVKVVDAAGDEVLQPLSGRLAGVIAKKDLEKGYWWSPSNSEIQGIVGMERVLTADIGDPASEVNLLNEHGILTIFNAYGTGYRTWGNRSAAWPTETKPINFINVRRVADILHESIEVSMLPFLDRPITRALIDEIAASVNAFIRTLIGRGALVDGSCRYDPADNPASEIALGHLTFRMDFMPPTPTERITFHSFIDVGLLKALNR